MKRRASGFTLNELLVVIAILAIIAGIFGWFALRTLRMNELRDASYQLLADLRRTRSNAQKTGLPVTLTLNPDQRQYSVQVQGQGAQNRTLPNAVKVSSVNGAANIMYQPPFGTIGSTGRVWQLQSPSDTNMKLFVKIVGVTGKVMLSDTSE